jgi:hypothetical protein
MNYRGALFLALLFGLASTATMILGQDSSQSAFLRAVPASTDCPINMRAQLRSRGETRPVGQAQTGGNGQKLHIALTNLKSVGIVGAEITVHGFITRGRVSPAQASQAVASEITKKINLVLKVNGKEDASTDIWLSGFATVSLIELDSVRYADRSTWHSSSQKTCHVGLDSPMLISSR